MNALYNKPAMYHHTISNMHQQRLEATRKADQDIIPKLIHRQNHNSIEIVGNCTQPLCDGFFFHVISIVSEHFEKSTELKVIINLDKLNTSSVKGLFNLFNLLRRKSQNGKYVAVEWIVKWEQEELIDTAIDFSDLYDFHFDIKIK